MSRQRLLTTIGTIAGSHAFFDLGKTGFVLPGMIINRSYEVSFPIDEDEAQDLISYARKSKYGKGSDTLFDENVRKTREIDAAQIEIKNPEWQKMLSTIIEHNKEQMGLEDIEVHALLHKLLIYEPGGFFKRHKDTEKMPGMFGSLIIGLPSKYEGGELVIEFNGKRQKIDFNQMGDTYHLPYVSFFADCDHEVKPVTSGYRICLVYNLVSKSAEQRPLAPVYQDKISSLTECLDEYRDKCTSPIVVLLGHQYTETNFSVAKLKSNDRPRARALLEAANRAEYYALPALLTYYQCGVPEYDDYSYEGYNEDMAEVHDEWYELHNWQSKYTPGLGNYSVDPSRIWSLSALDDVEPIEKEVEGFMGNYGPTLEYFYRYGSIVLWPKKQLGNILAKCNEEVRLEWLAYFLKEKETWNESEKSQVKDVIRSFYIMDKVYNQKAEDISNIAQSVLRLADYTFFEDTLNQLFFTRITSLPAIQWMLLITEYHKKGLNANTFSNNVKNLKELDQLVKVAVLLDKENSPISNDFIPEMLSKVPAKLSAYRFGISPETKVTHSICVGLMHLLPKYANKKQIQDIVNEILKEPGDLFIRNVASKCLLQHVETINGNLFTNLIYAFTLKRLTNLVSNEPQPPKDWKRSIPDNPHYRGAWKFLKSFMESPEQSFLDYKKPQADRKLMEEAIKDVKVDLKLTTIKKGSPHTLRITKTNESYKKAHQIWQHDVELLNRLKMLQ